jgi:hypothetical protein
MKGILGFKMDLVWTKCRELQTRTNLSAASYPNTKYESNGYITKCPNDFELHWYEDRPLGDTAVVLYDVDIEGK